MNSRIWVGLFVLVAAALGWEVLVYRNGGLFLKISSERKFMDGGVEKSYHAEYLNLLKPGKTYFRTLHGDFVPFFS